MQAIDVNVAITGSEPTTIEEVYANDKNLPDAEARWHEFGIFFKEAIAANRIQDKKKEVWNAETQTWTCTFYCDDEDIANGIIAEFDSNFWIAENENHTVTFSTRAVSSNMEVVAAVAITSDWFDNPNHDFA